MIGIVEIGFKNKYFHGSWVVKEVRQQFSLPSYPVQVQELGPFSIVRHSGSSIRL